MVQLAMYILNRFVVTLALKLHVQLHRLLLFRMEHAQNTYEFCKLQQNLKSFIIYNSHYQLKGRHLYCFFIPLNTSDQASNPTLLFVKANASSGIRKSKIANLLQRRQNYRLYKRENLPDSSNQIRHGLFLPRLHQKLLIQYLSVYYFLY